MGSGEVAAAHREGLAWPPNLLYYYTVALLYYGLLAQARFPRLPLPPPKVAMLSRSTSRRLLCFLPCCLLLLAIWTSPAATRAQDWIQFRGPGGAGRAHVQSAPRNWSDDENDERNIAWRTPIAGLGWSSPSVRDGRVWLTTALVKEGSLRAVCLDAKTGRELVNVEVFHKDNLGRVHRKNSQASPSAYLEKDRLYVNFGAHGVACLSQQGEILWRQVLEYKHAHGPGGSAVVFEDLLILNCDGSDVQYVAALNKHTGELVWKTPRAHTSQARINGEKSVPMAYTTPILVDVNGKTQLISAASDHIAGYDPRTGRELWWSSYDGYSNVASPVVGGGLVFVSSGYNNATFYAIRLGGSGDVSETHAVCTLKKSVPKDPSPLVLGDEIYLVDNRGVATCLDVQTGKKHWQKRLGGNFSASPLYAAGRIYFLNEEGKTTIIEPGAVFNKLAENEVAGRTLASITPQEGALLLRTDTHLLRIEEPAP